MILEELLERLDCDQYVKITDVNNDSSTVAFQVQRMYYYPHILDFEITSIEIDKVEIVSKTEVREEIVMSIYIKEDL